MSRDTSGNFTLPPSNPVFAGDVIDPVWANDTLLADIAPGLTDSLSRSGLGGMQAPLGMAGFQIKAVGSASVVGDAPNALQIRNLAFSMLTAVSSDAGGNDYVGTQPLVGTAPTTGSAFYFIADHINTDAMTLNVDGTGAKPILINGMAAEAGAVQIGTLVAVVLVGSSYRAVGGATGTASNGLNAVVSNNSDVLSVGLSGSPTGNIMFLQLHANVARGLAQLDASAKIPAILLSPFPTSFIGQWDAGPGLNPSNGTAAGQFYIISDAGNLTIFRTSVAPNYTAQVTAVVPGDAIVWNTINTAAQPTGWYYVPSVVSALSASAISNTATPSFPAVTTLQAWMDAVDPFYMPKTGGTFTGPVLQAAAPATATTLANRQYVDNAIAGISTGVASFNTRTGIVTLISADVSAALGFSPANAAGQAFAGAVSSGQTMTAKGFAPVPESLSIGGSNALDFVNGQSKIITLTSNLTISAISNVPVGGIIRLTFILGAFDVVAWPASVKWVNATVPTLTSGAQKRAIVALENDGTNLLATSAIY